MPRHTRFLILCLMVALACACARRPSSTADVPRLIPTSYNITVAPFTQPTNAIDLIMGRIPEAQGAASSGDLPLLDERLRAVLQRESKRHFAYTNKTPRKLAPTRYKSSEQPRGLEQWLAVGRKAKAQLLLVPMLLDWHQRAGSRAGVTLPAHVRVEFFLLKVSDGTVMNRSVYEVEQTGLVNDLLSVGDFVKRGAAWVTAEELAEEGMVKAVKELGL